MAEDTTSRADLEKQISDAIAACEQILEAMPDDRASLEALQHAYAQLGEKERARAYLIRLVRVLLLEGDREAAGDYVEPLRELGSDDADAVELLRRLEPEPDRARTEPMAIEEPHAPEVSLSVNMAEELSFLWNLMQAGEITQEEYAGIVQDLTDMSASASAATVSVPHALEARGFKTLDRIILFAAKDSDTPYIALDAFDFPREAVSILPIEVVVHRGALVFEMMGRHALAVVLNPYDRGLRRDVERLSGCKCHFFMTRASEFDRAVGRVTEVGVERTGAE